MKKITDSGEYPRQWVKEYQTAIKKTSHPPVSESDLRLLSCTAFFSKVYEAFIREWLMPFISPHIDTVNYGGMRHSSTTHYMLKLLHFIHENLDKREPHAVVMAQVDILKAFNNVSHMLVIQDMFDMAVPGWLLKIMVSYLTNRKMTLRYNGVESDKHMLKASSPQGVYLGVLIFLIKFNGAFLRPPIPRSFLTGSTVANITCHSSEFTARYVDNSSRAVAFSLRDCLEEVRKEDIIRPVTYHQRTGHRLKAEHNSLQVDLDNFCEFTKKNEFQINHKKSTIMIFNFSKSLDFDPIFKVASCDQLDVVSETKTLGIVLSENLKWEKHVQYICDKASSRIWTLRRLMEMKMDYEFILECYFKEIRTILEYGVVIFHSSLTQKQSNAIESIQRKVLYILNGYLNINLSYSESCILYCTESLKSRRLDICKIFIK